VSGRFRGGGDPDRDDEVALFLDPRALAEQIIRKRDEPKPSVGEGVEPDRDHRHWYMEEL
jgi:hypothetical protein